MEREPTPDNRPDWIKTNEIGIDEVEYNGKKIPYTILKKEAGPTTLPGFLGCGNRATGEHLFISEEVPEQFRTPQLLHEIIEFTELSGQKGRCVEALKRELTVVPEKMREEYLTYRRNFFARLVTYYQESKNEEFKAEIQASYEFLLTL